MDALALLCALHADGPAALQRLRQAGRSSLEQVLELEPESLAGLLATSPAAAQRFQREARHLAERVGAGLLEREDGELEHEGAVPVRHSAVPGREGAAPQAEAPAAPAREAAYASALQRWRELDQADPPAGGPEPEPSAAPATPLTALNELGATLLQRLERAEVRSLEDLAAQDPLELVQRAGMEFSNAARFTALARRALAASTPVERFSRAEPLGAGQREYVLQPAPRPERVLQQETAGGPFA
jgi:hypothetical protein